MVIKTGLFSKFYSLINWRNAPSTSTPINETNLGRMDAGINEMDNRIVLLDSKKANLTDVNIMVASVVLDPVTGILTVTAKNGTVNTYDLAIEKVVTNFIINDQNELVLTLADGTQQIIDMARFLYAVGSTATISLKVENQTIKAEIINGSVTMDKLDAVIQTEFRQYMLDAQSARDSALQYSKISKRFAVGDENTEGSETDNAKYYKEEAGTKAIISESFAKGGTGAREGEDIDNAKYYMEQAKAVSAIEIAKPDRAGIVKPDDTTITADKDGTIHVTDVTSANITATEDTTGFPIPAELETAGGMLGKIRKWMQDFADFKTGIITLGKLVNNGLCTEEGFAADARQLNPNIPDTLAAQLASLNSDLTPQKVSSGNIQEMLYTQTVPIQLYATENTVQCPWGIGIGLSNSSLTKTFIGIGAGESLWVGRGIPGAYVWNTFAKNFDK